MGLFNGLDCIPRYAVPLTIRPATIEDAVLLWHWRNDPETRAMSSDTTEITLDQHINWLTKRLKNAAYDGSAIVIAELDGSPIGTGRIDRGWDALSRTVDSCLLGYSINKDHRGHGYGNLLVTQLVALAQNMGYSTVKCRIRRTNSRSIMCAAMSGVNAIELF